MNQDQQQLIEKLAMLELQNWALMAVVMLVGTGLFFMIRVAWAELKQSNKEHEAKLGEHAIALGVLMERHETGQAIQEAGEKISEAIKYNSNRLVEKLQAITPPTNPRGR